MKVSNGLAYLFFLICSLLLWVACFYAFCQTTKGISYDLLEEKSTAVTTSFNLTTKNQIKDIISELSISRQQHKPLSTAVTALSQSRNGKSYYIINTQGLVIAGKDTNLPSFSPSIVTKSRQQGYTHYFVDLNNSPDKIATIFPYGTQYYIAQVEDTNSFAAWSVAQVDFPVEIAALLQKNGTILSTSNQSKAEIDDLKGSLGSGELDTIQRDGYSTYHVYMPVSNSQNLIIGATVSTRELFPLAYRLLPFLMVAILIVFSGLCISFYLTRKRRFRQLPSRPGDRDLLTGLLNEASLETSISQFFKSNDPGAYNLVAMDVVAFRRFNVMFGQKAGDALLNAIGRCFIDYYCCGCRLNGDIFVFMTKSTDQSQMITTLENRLDQFLVEDLTKQARAQVSYNFGIYPLESNFIYREAYDGALMALKMAKHMPDQNSVSCDRKLRQQIRFKKVIEASMFDAVKSDEFKLYIQPKFYAKDASCCGGEALVRWVSDDVGFLPPSSFIPIFEENGFIIELDFHMMDKVFYYMQRLINKGITPMPISINQSRITISSLSYMERLKALVSRYTVPLHLIEIEITESAVIEDCDMIIALAQEYQRMGFTVAMDDFGTGYSSLNTLRMLPVDVLKIDKDFLKEADTSVKGRRIIQGIVDMSRDIMIKTVCEGVETQTQYDFLKRFGCDIIQGYYLCEPIPYDEYETLYLSRYL